MQPAFLGRGHVRITAPLLPSGAVDVGSHLRPGNNWPPSSSNPTDLVMPPGRSLGNCSSLVLSPQAVVPSTAAFPRPGQRPGGAIIQSVSATISLYGLGAANLATMIAGTRHQAVGRDIVDSIPAGGAIVRAGDMLFASTPLDLAVEVTATPSWTTWDSGIHYVPGPFGIQLLHGFSAPANGHISLSYRSAGGTDQVEGMQRNDSAFGLVFEGLNTMNQSPIRADIYRATLQPTQSVPLLGDEVAVVSLTLAVNPVQPVAAGPARWFRIHQMDTP